MALRATLILVIRSFRHAGLEKFFTTGSKSGIRPAHERKLRLQLTVLDSATKIGDIAKFQAWSLHALKGEMAGKWAISVNGNWRLVFEFDGMDVHLVDYKDYH